MGLSSFSTTENQRKHSIMAQWKLRVGVTNEGHCYAKRKLQKVSYFDDTAAGNRGGFHWDAREESSGGSSQTQRDCPGSRTQVDQELAATQTHQVNGTLELLNAKTLLNVCGSGS